MPNFPPATAEDTPIDDTEVPVPSTEGLPSPLERPPSTEKDQPQTVDNRMSIKVHDNQGSEVTFKVKQDTMLGKLMHVYCTKNGKSPNSVRFLLNGSRIKPDDTPASVSADNLTSFFHRRLIADANSSKWKRATASTCSRSKSGVQHLT
jgi:hypothetical protein